MLQQKISNLQAKIAVIQKTQSTTLPTNYNYTTANHSPVIAPKYTMGQMGQNVPVNLRNMVLNLQQQQAQNIQNSLKNQHAAQQALQAAKLAQKTLIGVQLQSSNKINSSPVSSPVVQTQAPLKTTIQPVQLGSSTMQTVNSPASNFIF